MPPKARKPTTVSRRQRDADNRDTQTGGEAPEEIPKPNPTVDSPLTEQEISQEDEEKFVDARTRDTATKPQGDQRAETAVLEQPEGIEVVRSSGRGQGEHSGETGRRRELEVDDSTDGTPKVHYGQQSPKGDQKLIKTNPQKTVNPSTGEHGHRTDATAQARHQSGRQSPLLRSPIPTEIGRSNPTPPLFKDATKEQETDYEPFNELRGRLARQRNALKGGFITPDDYVMNAFDIMQQADMYYKEVHATAREARREEKRPVRKPESIPTVRRNESIHGSGEDSDTEAELIRAAQEESRKTHREEQARKATRDERGNQRGEASTARLAEGDRSSRQNRAVEINQSKVNKPMGDEDKKELVHTIGNRDTLINDEIVGSWSIPEYPASSRETELEAEFRDRWTEFVGLQKATEMITQMHRRELQAYLRKTDLEEETNTKDPDYDLAKKRLKEYDEWFTESYHDLLENISLHVLACRRLIERNHMQSQGRPNKLTIHAGRLIQRMSALGNRIAILQKARDDVKRSLNGYPEKRIHHVAHERVLNGIVIDLEPLPKTKSEDPRAFDNYFFPELIQVSPIAGNVPRVEVIERLHISRKSRNTTPEQNGSENQIGPAIRVPKFVLKAIPPDDDDGDSSDSGDSKKGGKKQGDDAPKESRKSRDSRERSEAPKGIDRFPTPSRETAHPHLPYVLPDPPGIGGIQFQDEKEVWIRLVRELDAEKGITEEDAAYRNAKSRSTALIRSALEANKNKAPGKSILAQNNIKVDANHITKYTGSSNTKDLERFASQLIDYFKMTNLLGPGEEMEEHRVLYASKRMDGKALDFYNDKISGATEEWSLIEVFQALESEFLPQSLYERARERFDTFRQRNGENVISAYRRLKTYSDAMFYEAGPYEMRYRFFHGVRDEIRGVLAHDDCTPEKGRWRLRDMLKIAINIEEGIEKAKSRHFTSSRNDYQSNSRERRQKRENRDHKRLETSKRQDDRGGFKKREEGRDRNEKTRADAKGPNDNNERYRRFSKNPAKKVDKDTCLKCHGKGHWASQCPKVFVGNVLVNPCDDQGSEDEPDNGIPPGEIVKEGENESSGNESAPGDPGYETAESQAWKSDCSSDNYPRSCAATVYELNKDEVAKCVAKVAKSESSEPPLHRNRVLTANGGKNVFGGVSSECISGYIKIGGMKAHTLIDTGSEVQMISANFAAAAKIHLKRLAKPIGIYLATAGHKSSVTHGCEAEMVAGSQKVQTYWDVGRLDYYDAILGIQALRSLRCSIDTGSNKVVLEDGSPLIKEIDLIHPSKVSGPAKRKDKRFQPKKVKISNAIGMGEKDGLTDELQAEEVDSINTPKNDLQ
jgi:hypothetical protein